MDLPKNITQIGEINPQCKIYVEDYVVSFLKQINGIANDKNMAVALYGITKYEGTVSYNFVYGAAKLDFLQKEVRHLSQAQQQEMEKLRVKYFKEYALLGYKILNGEMIEGFHICEQGICRYISGYARFYEKNDSMLAYMLDYRGGEGEPEVVNQDKYDTVKKRQEERKLKNEESRRSNFPNIKSAERNYEISDKERDELKNVWAPEKKVKGSPLKKMKYSAAVIFALLCMVGISGMNGTLDLQGVQMIVDEIFEDGRGTQSSDKIPVAAQTDNVVTPVTSTLIAEDKLADALIKENQTEETQDSTKEVTAEQDEGNAQKETEESAEVMDNNVVSENISESSVDTPAVSYTIKKGDTLRGISLNKYGNIDMIKEICEINNIEDPDDIKVGQKILLP